MAVFCIRRKKKVLAPQYSQCEVIDAKDINFEDIVPSTRSSAYNNYATLSEVMEESVSGGGIKSQGSRTVKKKGYESVLPPSQEDAY